MSLTRNLASLLALDKFARLMKIIAANGGPVKSASKMWKTDTLKEGKFKGQDAFGNKYYENPYYMLGRSRWVEYNPAFNFEYDPSQVTPEWHGWLHYRTDRLPSEDCAKLGVNNCDWSRRWLMPHTENMTNTPSAYYPYSTIATPRVTAWDGISVCKRLGAEK